MIDEVWLGLSDAGAVGLPRRFASRPSPVFPSTCSLNSPQTYQQYTHIHIHTCNTKQPFLGAADGLIDALFPSTLRRASEGTATTTPVAAARTEGGSPPGASSGAAAAAAVAAAAAGAGRAPGLYLSSSPPPAYADVIGGGAGSPLQRFLPPSERPPATRPAAATVAAAAAGVVVERPVPEDSTVVADRSPEVAPPPHVRRLASDGTEAYNTSGSGVGGGGGYRGGLGWEEDDDGDGFDDGVSSLNASVYSEDGTFQEPYMRSAAGGGGAQGGQGL